MLDIIATEAVEADHRMKPPRKEPTFTVRPFEARRFFVSSSEGSGREHLVDLDEHKGRGECGCEDFQFRVAPEYRAGNEAILACKHISAARAFEKESPPEPSHEALPNS